MGKFLAGFKNLTHYLAVGMIAAYGFAMSPAGQALVKQYPKLSGVVGMLGGVMALYYSGEKPQ